MFVPFSEYFDADSNINEDIPKIAEPVEQRVLACDHVGLPGNRVIFRDSISQEWN